MAPIFNTIAPKCANCNKSVYHAEQVLCLGKVSELFQLQNFILSAEEYTLLLLLLFVLLFVVVLILFGVNLNINVNFGFDSPLDIS